MTTPDFTKMVPGFDFLQNLLKGAGGGLPAMNQWIAPTLDAEEVDKRIQELRTVQFWLEQNAKMLAATIQALEVQRMTLATLKNMNFSLGDVANALKIKAADAVSGLSSGAAGPAPTQFAGLEIPPRTYGRPSESAPAEAPEADPQRSPAPKRRKSTAHQKPAADAASAGMVDPMQWWGALSQQFQTIAANAMKDVARQTTLDTTRNVASGLTEQAVKTATGMAGKAADNVARSVGVAVGMGQAAARAVTRPPRTRTTRSATGSAPQGKTRAAAPKDAAAPAAARQPAKRKAAAQALGKGDWPLPSAYFSGAQETSGDPAPTPRPARKANTRTAGGRARRG